MKDSWRGDLFFTYSAYEMKNLLISSLNAFRILICSEEETVENNVLYAAISMEIDMVHMDIEGELYGMALLKPGVSGSSKLFYCPKSIYKTKKEFLDDFKENYGGDINDRYYETQYGWLMDEDNTITSKQFCIDVMRGKKI